MSDYSGGAGGPGGYQGGNLTQLVVALQELIKASYLSQQTLAQIAAALGAGGAPLNPVTPAIPASGTAVKNTGTAPVSVYLSGGTVSAVSVNGLTTGLTAGLFILAPQSSIVLTYSAAPSWVWVGS